MKTVSPLDILAERAAENPEALAELALILDRKGQEAYASALALRALEAAPADGNVRGLAGLVLARNVPGWHFRIVRDEARNAAYAAALARAVTAQTKVLEIGTGSAILAMMAARAGAGEVVTCEMVPAIAEAARTIVARNGYEGRVRVIAKKSSDLDVEADLGGRADLFVSEIVTNSLLGEDMLPLTEHAVRELLVPGAQVIPRRGLVRVALARDEKFERHRMDTVDGFDLSPFNRLAAGRYGIKRNNDRLTLMSAPAALFDFDFQSGGPYPASDATAVLTSEGGQANGIVQWIALQMDEEGWYENAPDRGGAFSAWDTVFWPFEEARDYPAGTQITVHGRHSRRSIRIWA